MITKSNVVRFITGALNHSLVPRSEQAMLESTDTASQPDSVEIRIEGTETDENGKLKSSEGRWQFVGGTGALEGVSGDGSYKGIVSDGRIKYDIEGTYWVIRR